MLELQIKDLCVAFNGKEILHNITFDIENGAFIGIVGPSGAGKSTLLKQINRLDPSKTGGSILWRGKDVDDYDVHELRRNLAYVFQKAVMFDGTTEENIKLSLKYGNEFKPEEIEAENDDDDDDMSDFVVDDNEGSEIDNEDEEEEIEEKAGRVKHKKKDKVSPRSEDTTNSKSSLGSKFEATSSYSASSSVLPKPKASSPSTTVSKSNKFTKEN